MLDLLLLLLSCKLSLQLKLLYLHFNIFINVLKIMMKNIDFLQDSIPFRVVQNNIFLRNTINKFYKRNEDKSISVFEFSTFHTKLPHEQLLSVLHMLMTISKFAGHWSKERSCHKICFSKQEINDAVSYLLSNCFFTIGLKSFCYIIVIPNGFDPAPFFYFIMKVNG